jgi:hypothetical protein
MYFACQDNFFIQNYFFIHEHDRRFSDTSDVDLGADREGHPVDRGIRTPLLEKRRIGVEQRFSLLEYFLDRYYIVVLPRHKIPF